MGMGRRRARAKPAPTRRAATRRRPTGARPIYTDHAFAQLTLAQESARNEALYALSLMRTQGLSLTAAAREAGLSRETMRAWVGRTLTKRGRRWAARPSDKLVRMMKVLTPRGMVTVPIYSSRTASTLGQYHAAVRDALRGDTSALRAFRGKSIRSGKLAYPLITRMDTLARLAMANELPENDIYGLRL